MDQSTPIFEEKNSNSQVSPNRRSRSSKVNVATLRRLSLLPAAMVLNKVNKIRFFFQFNIFVIFVLVSHISLAKYKTFFRNKPGSENNRFFFLYLGTTLIFDTTKSKAM